MLPSPSHSQNGISDVICMGVFCFLEHDRKAEGRGSTRRVVCCMVEARVSEEQLPDSTWWESRICLL